MLDPPLSELNPVHKSVELVAKDPYKLPEKLE
jgi:hypothetical protein